MSHPWSPILAPPLVVQAKAALEAILETLPTPDQVEWGASLSGGHAGFALVFAYAALAEEGTCRQIRRNRALAHMETAGALLPRLGGNPGLYAGFSGVAWTVDHLRCLGVLPGGADLNEEIDEALLGRLAHAPWPGSPELIGGLAGIGLYALDRPASARSRRIVHQILGILQSTAETSAEGTAWFDPPDQLTQDLRGQHPDGAFNLGVSHGNPGIIGFLAEAWHRGFRNARPLLDTSMTWLLSRRSPKPNGSVFGCILGRGQAAASDGGRLSWCYGDLGISAILLLAAAVAGKDVWRRQAIQLGLNCTERPAPWQGVVDPGLCHGAAGNAHLFTRLYHATGLIRFRTWANRFYEGALAMRGKDRAAGGFQAYTPALPNEPPAGSWSAVPGLLTGSAGIGLSLLGALTAVEPAWDRHLLIHVPPLPFTGR